MMLIYLLLRRLGFVIVWIVAGMYVLEHWNPDRQPLLITPAAFSTAVSEAPYQNCRAPSVPHFLVHRQAKAIA